MDAKRVRPGKTDVCIVGMGFVGITLGASLADVRYTVRGVDINLQVVDLINQGRSYFFEKGLDKLLKKYGGNQLEAFHVSDHVEADVYIVTVGTPTNEDNQPNIQYLRDAVAWIGKRIKAGDLVVLRSTVPPGTTRSVALPQLERDSGLVAGKDFFLSFAPERVIEGDSMRELREIPQIIAGVNDISATITRELFEPLADEILLLDHLEEAEFAKLLNNVFRDLSFAFANEFSLLADTFNIDACKVIRTANHNYPRNRIALPSPGVGGSCLIKDPYLLDYSCKIAGFEPVLLTSSRKVNEYMERHVADTVNSFCLHHSIENPKIFICGIAFKGQPETSDIRDSPALRLLECIDFDSNIFCHDYVVPEQAIAALGVQSTSIEQGFKDANVVVFMNNHKKYSTLDISELVRTMGSPALIFDGWSVFSESSLNSHPKVTYANLSFNSSRS